MDYECYFTDFTGQIFRFYLDSNGNGPVPLNLRTYLFNTYNIIKHEFIPSTQFIYRECAFNLVNYLNSLHSDALQELQNLYVIGPAYMEPHLTTIDYQGNVSGTPYYDQNSVEPRMETMIREVKEETFLSLRAPVNNYDLCFLTDTYLPATNEHTKLVLETADGNIYGPWAYEHGIDRMSSMEIDNMERSLNYYKKDRDFRNWFNQHKIALTLIGDLNRLYNFYAQDIMTMSPPPHREIRINDFGVVLLPLSLVYRWCQDLL